MRVLVAGGSGFVGSALVSVLRERCDVLAPSHADLDLTRPVLPDINRLATPVLATDAGELIWRALERGVTGILHCVGREHIDRAERIPVDTLLEGPACAST
jgi:nucleoside-diphosphate-sugar epimerase